MRIVVLSDSHKNVGRLFAAVERHLDNADLYIFLGDGEDDFDAVIDAYLILNTNVFAATAIGIQIIPIKWKLNLPAKEFSFLMATHIMLNSDMKT